jgi:hypothetical protein
MVYLCSCCGETCSSAPSRHSSPASLGRHYGTWRRRCPALTAWRRRASGTTLVDPPMSRPEAPRRRTLEASPTLGGTS